MKIRNTALILTVAGFTALLANTLSADPGHFGDGSSGVSRDQNAFSTRSGGAWETGRRASASWAIARRMMRERRLDDFKENGCCNAAAQSRPERNRDWNGRDNGQ